MDFTDTESLRRASGGDPAGATSMITEMGRIAPLSDGLHRF